MVIVENRNTVESKRKSSQMSLLRVESVRNDRKRTHTTQQRLITLQVQIIRLLIAIRVARKLPRSCSSELRAIWHVIISVPIVFGEMWVRRADTQGVLRHVRRRNGEESAGWKMRPGREIQRDEELHRRGGVQRRMVRWTVEQGTTHIFETPWNFSPRSSSFFSPSPQTTPAKQLSKRFSTHDQRRKRRVSRDICEKRVPPRAEGSLDRPREREREREREIQYDSTAL